MRLSASAGLNIRNAQADQLLTQTVLDSIFTRYLLLKLGLAI